MICLHANPLFKPEMERFYALGVDTLHLMQKSVSPQA
ncbi:MAG: hypothetical protein DID89_2727547625 [Candidatus Nitrotoga sp. CP45]|nr:MAG: hypothetical protein DID89_2727547625 [Candidatus Nitrotoga sp. CP45]